MTITRSTSRIREENHVSFSTIFRLVDSVRHLNPYGIRQSRSATTSVIFMQYADLSTPGIIRMDLNTHVNEWSIIRFLSHLYSVCVS